MPTMTLTYGPVPDLVRGVIDNKCRERWLELRQNMREAQWKEHEQTEPRTGQHWQVFTAKLRNIPVRRAQTHAK